MVCALAAVAPGVRFNILAILATPAFCFASALRVRTSSFVHSRRTAVFFLGKSSFLQSQNARFSRSRVLRKATTRVSRELVSQQVFDKMARWRDLVSLSAIKVVLLVNGSLSRPVGELEASPTVAFANVGDNGSMASSLTVRSYAGLYGDVDSFFENETKSEGERACPVQARKRAQRSTLVQRGRPANPGWRRLPASDTRATKRQVRLVRPDLPSIHEHCDLGHFLNDRSLFASTRAFHSRE